MKHAKIRTLLECGCLLALVLTIVLTLAAERYQAASAAVREDTLRLHILANSDTVEDQLTKLKVRDAILTELGPLLQDAADKQTAMTRLQAALPDLLRLARRVSGQTAAARLETLDFAAKDYGDFALPGGEYTALRIELGQAKGHNWFCVLYPALCVDGAVADYPTAEENALVFGRYKIRFALWDWLVGEK